MVTTAATAFRFGKRKITEQEVQKINHVAAPLVNTIYSIAMCIESYSLDLKEKEIHEAACALRAEVCEVNKEMAEPFGEWAEKMEVELNKTTHRKQDLLYWLCAKIYTLTVEMQDFYRKYDPLFEFYQKDQIIALKQAQGMFPKSTAKECNEIVRRIMNE